MENIFTEEDNQIIREAVKIWNEYEGDKDEWLRTHGQRVRESWIEHHGPKYFDTDAFKAYTILHFKKWFDSN